MKLNIIVLMFFMCLMACQSDDVSVAEIVAAEQHVLSDVSFPGLNFKHHNQMDGSYYFHEMMGAGLAVLDVDNDGDFDVYLRQGSVDLNSQSRDQLFINQLIETGTVSFIEMGEEFGIKNFGYGMGIAVADFDNDGFSDIFLSNLGADVLLKNKQGNFTEVSGPWQKDVWSTAVVFLDYDQDGWLDLYVGHYSDYSIDSNKACYNPKSQLDYCSPKSYAPVVDAIYQNKQGEFVEQTEALGLTQKFGFTLGVVAEDLNQDGWVDLYVANDSSENNLWLNQQGELFTEHGFDSGLAVNVTGLTEGSMGIGISDFDQDMDFDLFLTHWDNESNTLYVNQDNGFFVDQSNQYNLVLLSKNLTGFGVAWLDVNQDLKDDLIIMNGAVLSIHKQRTSGDPLPLKQLNQVLIQTDNKEFVQLNDSGLSFINQPQIGRALALVDIDNDGDKDILTSANHGSVEIIQNNSKNMNWLGLSLVDKWEKPALGAQVIFEFNDQHRALKRHHNDGSYLSAQDQRVLIHWQESAASELSKIIIKWPDGTQQKLGNLPSGQYHRIEQAE